MERKRVSAMIMGTVVLLSLLLSACGTHVGSATRANVPLRTDGMPIPLSPGNLIGKSFPEVGLRVQQLVQLQGHVRSGESQVLAIRSIQRADMPVLGLGCIVDFDSMEEPPLVLVILKGDFQWTTSTNDFVYPKYLAYVMDVWAGSPVSMQGSMNGAEFRYALNNLSLPTPAAHAVSTCPDVPGPRMRHYGQAYPASTPWATSIATPMPAATASSYPVVTPPPPTYFVPPTFPAPVATHALFGLTPGR